MRRPNFWNYNLLLKCQNQLQKSGYLYIKNLSPNFQWIGFSQILTQTRLIAQAQSVYVAEFQAKNAFHWHTDGSYYLIPPRYLAVWCRESEEHYAGIFRLVDGQALLCQGFSELEQRKLMKKHYGFISTDGTQKLFAPILDCPSRTEDIIRYSESLFHNVTQETSASDEWSKKISIRIAQFCQHNHLQLCLQKNALLIIDNHRMLHCRTVLSNSKRYLQQIWLGQGKE